MIIDGINFGWKQLKSFGLNDARNNGAFTECYPLWYRETHIINTPRLFNMAYAIIKPFLSETFQNSIMFHGSDYKSLHSHISPEILPKELGGKRGNFENSSISKEMLKSEKYFTQLRQWKILTT